jgi:hypothetical protein
MGLTGRSRHSLVARLEDGPVDSPELRTVALFLRACGAKWLEFSGLLDRVELPPLETSVEPQQALPPDRRDSPYGPTAR